MRNRLISCVLIFVVCLSLLLCGCANSSGGGSRSSGRKAKEMEVTELAEYVQERTVTITVDLDNGGKSTGSGFFIDDCGTLVTCYHVIDGGKSIEIEIDGGAKYGVDYIVDFNEMTDIAVLKFDLEDTLYLDIIEDEIKTGETVYAVGSSLGFLDGTFSNGIISSVDRKVGVAECLQTTAAISSGNSGGPLVNTRGEVLGINAFSYDAGENLNLAVKMEMLDELDLDKDWNMNDYKEWYTKEASRSYMFMDEDGSLYRSTVHTYHHVTGRECQSLTFDGDFVDYYQSDAAAFFYDYYSSEFDEYTEYLKSRGFVCDETTTDDTYCAYFYTNEMRNETVIIAISSDSIMIAPEKN